MPSDIFCCFRTIARNRKGSKKGSFMALKDRTTNSNSQLSKLNEKLELTERNVIKFNTELETVEVSEKQHASCDVTRIDDDSSHDSDMHSETPEGSTTAVGFKVDLDDSEASIDSVPEFLTIDERRKVVQAWNQVPDTEALCERIFVHVFILEPKLLALFNVRDAPFDKLKDDPTFKAHATRFNRFFTGLLEYVEENNYDHFRRLCLAVGERHAQIVRLNFQVEWWQVFTKATMSCMQPYCRRKAESTQNAWITLMSLIITLMKKGLEEKNNRPQFIEHEQNDQYNDLLTSSTDEAMLRSKKLSTRLRTLSARKSSASMGAAPPTRKSSRGLSIFEEGFLQQFLNNNNSSNSTISPKRSASVTTNSTNHS